MQETHKQQKTNIDIDKVITRTTNITLCGQDFHNIYFEPFSLPE
jgi:hypothetical protein